ncbi:MAG: hypothetical protein KKH01_02620 [Firmicutes bacterium]|nr:hypothetical protein [Bacillota bacterium]
MSDNPSMDKLIKTIMEVDNVLDNFQLYKGPIIDFEPIESPLYEQNKILKSTLESINETVKLMKVQLEIAIQQKEEAVQSSKRSKRNERITLVISILSIGIAIIAIIV